VCHGIGGRISLHRRMEHGHVGSFALRRCKLMLAVIERLFRREIAHAPTC